MFQLSAASAIAAPLHGAVTFCSRGFRDKPAAYRKTRSFLETVLTLLAHQSSRLVSNCSIFILKQFFFFFFSASSAASKIGTGLEVVVDTFSLLYLILLVFNP